MIRVLENSLVEYKSDEYIVEFSIQGALKSDEFDPTDSESYWVEVGDYETIDQFELDTQGYDLKIDDIENLLKHLKTYEE